MANPQPINGLPMRAPKKTPDPDDIIIGYNVVEPKTGCIACDGLKIEGWIGAAALFLLGCWPCVCIPCCLQSCHEPYQVPVYGKNHM